MHFIPSGCVPMHSAIDTTVEHLFEIDPAAVKANEPEYVRLVRYQEWVVGRGAFVPPPIMVGEDDPHKAFLDRMELLGNERKQLAAARDRAITSLWQALGDGALKAAAVTDYGHIIDVPVWAWRAKGGRDALIQECISWWDTSVKPPVCPEGRPVIEEAGLDRWLMGAATSGMEHRLIRRLVSLMRANPDRPRSKSDLRREAKVDKFVVSDTGWDRCWAAAVEQANTPKWSAPGPRRKE
jgi:hypothetical protein